MWKGQRGDKMGLLEKVKNMFTEEVEVEETKPIKKEVIQVEIPAPEVKERRPQVQTEVAEAKPVSESTVLNREEKFVFPVYFDDKDFDTLEKREEEKVKPKEPAPYGGKPKEPAPYGGKSQEAYHKPKEAKALEPESKIFKPTPIISPVYGILDKNYRKEDITSKKKADYYEPNRSLNVDDVRKKAFGTLEDDLESTLFGNNSILFREEPQEKEPEKPSLDELMLGGAKHAKKELSVTDDLEAMLGEPDFEENQEETNEISESTDTDDFDFTPESDLRHAFDLEVEDTEDTEEREEEMKPKKKKEEKESLDESDLFNLIDSMYDKGEDE